MSPVLLASALVSVMMAMMVEAAKGGGDDDEAPVVADLDWYKIRARS